MNVDRVNEALAAGNLDVPGLFPRLEALHDAPAVFQIEMGLEALPDEPGVLLIRGARQYGKSTWVEAAMRDTVREHGPGTAFFLDGDYLKDADHLSADVSRLRENEKVSAFLPVRDISVIGRNTQGVRLIGLEEGEKVVGVAPLAEMEGDESGKEPAPAA